MVASLSPVSKLLNTVVTASISLSDSSSSLGSSIFFQDMLSSVRCLGASLSATVLIALAGGRELCYCFFSLSSSVSLTIPVPLLTVVEQLRLTPISVRSEIGCPSNGHTLGWLDGHISRDCLDCLYSWHSFLFAKMTFMFGYLFCKMKIYHRQSRHF